MSNKKQTSVDWLVEKWSIQGTLYSSDINQAKEMDKQQKADAFKKGQESAYKIS